MDSIVIQIYNKIMNEQVYNVYHQDVIAAVDRRMAVRGEGFLNVVQSKLTAETNFEKKYGLCLNIDRVSFKNVSYLCYFQFTR